VGSANSPTINLTVLAPGNGAIIVTRSALHHKELHYMLLWRTATGWEIYNSNSAKLNPARLVGGCPQAGQASAIIQTDLLDVRGLPNGNPQYEYLGLYIAC
jgi:hypothetical protein